MTKSVRIYSFAIALAAALVAVGLAGAETPTTPQVSYVANEGFLLSSGGQRVLIDALFGAGVNGYPVPPVDLREQLETGEGGWGDVEVALASHYHPDHFDPDSVARFLRANPQAMFVSTPQAIARLETEYPGERALLSRARAVLPVEGAVERLEIRGIEIEVLNLHHGRRTPPVENLGFVVTLGGSRFLHLGDTEAKIEIFEPHLQRLVEVDVGLLPFWFLASDWRAKLVRERIRPRWIVVAHLPLPTAPSGHFARWQSYTDLVRVIETAFPEARFPVEPGTTYRLQPW